MVYQLGWTTLPGLRGISVSGFRATPADVPDNERGVAVRFANEAERDAFLRQIEEAFTSRRFTNAADAFDTVKAYALERAAQR
jgi:cell division septum initiation protein DivIVA